MDITAKSWKYKAKEYRMTAKGLGNVTERLIETMLDEGMSFIQDNEYRWHNDRAERAEAENARLREALEKIANVDSEEMYRYMDENHLDEIDYSIYLARAALHTEQREE